MYKLTKDGKTMVGCNEDAWRLTSRIWFENGTATGQYGACFTGSRFDGSNGFAPQSGMNEHGLAYSRLSSHTPPGAATGLENKKPVENPTRYLKDILHSCRTVEEVMAFIGQYDHSFFKEDVFIYIDRTGKYLVVEPFTLTLGEEPGYVLSNFCPSATPEAEALKLERYRNGRAFLDEKMDTSLAFCTALSDTMHVCRAKVGDGTLLTSIWDLNGGSVNLYFYHDYRQTVRFDIQAELAKGDHILELPPLFPPNAEFEALRTYATPHNSLPLKLFLMAAAGLFLFSAGFFLYSYLRGKGQGRYASIKLLFFPLGIMLLYYMFVLFRTTGIFYFPSPYQDYQSVLVSASSYIPFLLLFLIVPALLINYRIFREKSWPFFPKWLFAFNNMAGLALLVLFIYWGFFGV